MSESIEVDAHVNESTEVDAHANESTEIDAHVSGSIEVDAHVNESTEVDAYANASRVCVTLSHGVTCEINVNQTPRALSHLLSHACTTDAVVCDCGGHRPQGPVPLVIARSGSHIGSTRCWPQCDTPARPRSVVLLSQLQLNATEALVRLGDQKKSADSFLLIPPWASHLRALLAHLVGRYDYISHLRVREQNRDGQLATMVS